MAQCISLQAGNLVTFKALYSILASDDITPTTLKFDILCTERCTTMLPVMHFKQDDRFPPLVGAALQRVTRQKHPTQLYLTVFEHLSTRALCCDIDANMA